MLLIILLAPITGQVDYNSQIQPIFNSYCTNCHGGAAGLSLTSYNNLMNGSNDGDVIIPYNHSSSPLWIHVNSGYMPPGNNDLTDDQVDLIAQWIDEGALEWLDCDPSIACARQKPVVTAYYTPPHAVKLIVMNPSVNVEIYWQAT